MKAYLAFYKHSGTWVDKIIRWGTSSKYSHVEIVVNELSEIHPVWYSSSPRDGGVRRMVRPVDTNRWDLFEVEIDEYTLNNHYYHKRGTGYDFLCIFFTHILPLGIHSSVKEVCSEFCGAVMGKPSPHKYSPQGLYELVKDPLSN